MPTDPRRPRRSSPKPWQRLPTTATWADLVAAPPELAQLRQIAAEASVRFRGFPPTPLTGGIAALFTGQRRTDKTRAAQVLANALQLELYRIDLSQVASKYIGETEKNLQRVFDAAEHGRAVLFFDEADALFGKRTEVKDAHDRYANLDVSRLLERLERFQGLAILATNHKQNLDDAFLRRLRYVVDFPPTTPREHESPWPPAQPAAHPPGAAGYPGVYVEALPAGTHTIVGVATSITAFVGRTLRGPRDAPSLVTSFNDFERVYGGLAADCPLGHAVRQFFDNGGTQAVIARVCHRVGGGGVDETAPITDADLVAPSLEATQGGLWLLDKADLVNLLCIPPLAPGVDVAASTWNSAIQYATHRRTFVIVDPPAAWTTAAQASVGVEQFVARDSHAALYFPRLRAADPLRANQLDSYAPCGAVAGLYARTDATRGVWQAPAGTVALLQGITEPTVTLTDAHSDVLNPLGINALRRFPSHGSVASGARTLAGADNLGSEWKYVPVRRTALFIEESLYRGLQWVVFESNAEPLWAEIRLAVGAFLQDLFREGAFQGATPRDAYFVNCDAATTTPLDIANGVVNLVVGFAPLKPAEFVILRIRLQAAPPA